MKAINISNELFIKNRYKLRERLPEDSSVVVFASDLMPRNGDQYHKFRQNSDFFYLTGINQEKSVLIMNPTHPEEKLREILLIQESTPEMEQWNGYKLTREDAQRISGIENIHWLGEYDSLLNSILYRSNNIYLDFPENLKTLPSCETREIVMSRDIRKRFPFHGYHRLAPVLHRLRMIKEKEEIELIKTACGITRDTFYRVLTATTPGAAEYEIEAEMTHEFLRKGSGGHAYDPIVAAGKDACILHYTDNRKKMKEGELLLMDFGAEWGNYASDCSRTIPVSGKFSERQAEVYDGLLEVFYEAQNMMIPGVLMQDFHNKVCRMMERLHIRLGLYTAAEAENHKGDKGLWFKYYMHGTSHSLGLDVHDVFDKTVEFAPGMVFTCEPGIYIPEEEIGIRIENDIIITPDGNIDLMHDIPVERKEIENLMQS